MKMVMVRTIGVIESLGGFQIEIQWVFSPESPDHVYFNLTAENFYNSTVVIRDSIVGTARDGLVSRTTDDFFTELAEGDPNVICVHINLQFHGMPAHFHIYTPRADALAFLDEIDEMTPQMSMEFDVDEVISRILEETKL